MGFEEVKQAAAVIMVNQSINQSIKAQQLGHTETHTHILGDRRQQTTDKKPGKETQTTRHQKSSG
jgi:hypothetical protein